MRTIQLDASGWRSPIDVDDALKDALGSCEGHGSSPDAWIDSIIWGGMNRVAPPYIIRFVGTSRASQSAREKIQLLIKVIQEAREWRRVNEGTDVDAILVDVDYSN